MKKVLFLIITIGLFLCSCANKQSAKARKMNGLVVFAHSDPVLKYDVIANLDHNAFSEIIQEIKGKKGLDAILATISTTRGNMNFAEQMRKMTALAKEKYPNADGIIVSDKSLEVQVIQFK